MDFVFRVYLAPEEHDYRLDKHVANLKVGRLETHGLS